MIQLVFSKSPLMGTESRQLEVPDFPYTERFCSDDKGEMRLCLSPLEYDGANIDLQGFISGITERIGTLWIYDREADPTHPLAVWNYTTLETYKTTYGVAVALSTRKEHVRVY